MSLSIALIYTMVQLLSSPAAPCVRPIAEGRQGVVVGTTSPLSVAAGLDILKQGGTAADAAVATSLAQVVECGGSYVSFAGIFAMMYFDAASGRVYSLNAGYNIPKAETDPKDIPGGGMPSGRTALVPGYMAGVDAALRRFGKLSRKQVFAPAIRMAEEGIKVSNLLSSMIESEKDVLGRLPETKRIFTKSDGTFFTVDDIFRQPEAAGTLRRVAERGADFMYTGEWAERFVAAVQRKGGRVSIEDMRAYRAVWEDPLKADFRGFQVFLPGMTSYGGIAMLEAVRILEMADLHKTGHFATSPHSLFWLMQISHCQIFGFLPHSALKSFQGLDLTARSRVNPKTTKALWRKVQDRELPFVAQPPKKGGSFSLHSDGIVVIDRWGNVAAVTHSSNTMLWGSTGLFVDGVSIPDSASFQQSMMQDAGPGKRLPDVMCPLIVVKDGKPFLASSAIGGGLHQCTVQVLTSILAFGLEPQAAAEKPAFLFPSYGLGPAIAQVEKGQFDPEVLDGVRALGQKVTEVTATQASALRGYWVGASIDPKTGMRRGFGTRNPPLPAIGAAY